MRLAHFATQAGNLLARLLHPESSPVSARPAEPMSGNLGASCFFPIETAQFSPLLPPSQWDQDPETGEALPVGPQRDLLPHRYLAARIAARHGWFAALAAQHAAGVPGAAAQAVAAMEGWLRQDLPGQGIAWAHASDLSIRLIHWHTGLSWLGAEAPASLRDALAGSALWHLRHLERRLPTAEADGLRRILHFCGMIVGGFTFPSLPESRRLRSEGLAGLRWQAGAQLFADGVAKDRAYGWMAQVWWALGVARAVCHANGAAFPADADAAFARGARFLMTLVAEVGELPAIGEMPPLDMLGTSYPLAWSLWNLTLAWKLDSGEPAPRAAQDPRLRWLNLSLNLPEPAGTAKTWSLWSFREGSLAVATMVIKNQPSRFIFDAGVGRGSPLSHPAPALLWQVGGIEVLSDPGSAAGTSDWIAAARSSSAHSGLSLAQNAVCGGQIVRGRVDGKKARIEADMSLEGGIVWQRELLLNQSRMIATDQLVGGAGPVQLCWQLGPGWELVQTEQGWTAKNASLTLIIQLPASLNWRVVMGHPAPEAQGWVWRDGQPLQAPCLIGTGEAGDRLVSRFEIR